MPAKQISLCSGEGVEIEQGGNPGLAVTKIGVKDGRVNIVNPCDGRKTLWAFATDGEGVQLLQGWCWATTACVVISFVDYNPKGGVVRIEVSSGFRPLRVVPVAQLGLFKN